MLSVTILISTASASTEIKHYWVLHDKQKTIKSMCFCSTKKKKSKGRSMQIYNHNNFCTSLELLRSQFVSMHIETVVQTPYVSSLCFLFSLGNDSIKEAQLRGRYVHPETWDWSQISDSGGRKVTLIFILWSYRHRRAQGKPKLAQICHSAPGRGTGGIKQW